MTPMTYLEFEQIVESTFGDAENNNPGHLRIGQIYFNILNSLHPHIAEELRGTSADPFYRNAITEDVKTFVSDRWAKQ